MGEQLVRRLRLLKEAEHVLDIVIFRVRRHSQTSLSAAGNGESEALFSSTGRHASEALLGVSDSSYDTRSRESGDTAMRAHRASFDTDVVDGLQAT